MEKSVIFLQSLLVLLLAKYVASSRTNCTCEWLKDFCKANITAVQGKVLGSQPADSNGSIPSDENTVVHKTRYRVNLTQIIINGSYELHLENNTFKIPVRTENPCHFNFTTGKSYVFLGFLNNHGKYSKLECTLDIPSRNKTTISAGFALGGDDTNFREICTMG
ncbi:hypothetical protein CHS0354_040069 [Potamilus streckersoni]|uniref:Uncharacterized protein n=1 Tax=Potamilus streckersoni TaxID=2493646 RepID=A0AAE0STK5_9BIVA|nr:hypothetical protein CHS0354_040069 [Potamilus streckersoni]